MTTLVMLVMEEVENLNEIDLSTVRYCYKTCDEVGPVYIILEDTDELGRQLEYR